MPEKNDTFYFCPFLEYRVLKLLSLETDYKRNFQSVYTLPGSVPWLRLICCSINQNRKRLRLSSCRLHLTFFKARKCVNRLEVSLKISF